LAPRQLLFAAIPQGSVICISLVSDIYDISLIFKVLLYNKGRKGLRGTVEFGRIRGIKPEKISRRCSQTSPLLDVPPDQARVACR
jgi:hypothetical protein